MAAAGGAAIGVVAVGVTTVADLPPAQFSEECWLRPTTIHRRTMRGPVTITVLRPMAQSITACAGSDHMIQEPGPILVTMATVILVHE